MRSRLLKIPVTIVMVSSLSACLAPNVAEVRNPIQDEYTQVSHLADKDLNIDSTHVAVGIKPHEMLNFVQPGQNQAGLLGLVVGTIMTSGANNDVQDSQRLIQPVRNAVLRYNFGSKFRLAVQNSLTAIDWLKVSYVGKYPSLQQHNVENLLQSNKDDTLFIIDSSYSFSPDFNSISVYCYAAMHSKNTLQQVDGVNRPSDRLIYQNKFSSTRKLDQSYQDTSQAIQKWSENDGFMVTQALNEALEDITNSLAMDIRQKKLQTVVTTNQ